MKKILIVEDSPTMKQFITFSLRRIKDLAFVEASDGVDGLKKISSDNFDLILVDINMPLMDGLKLISLIRSNERYKDIPIIVITTEGGEEDREKALSLGANFYITKPIQAVTLQNVIKKYLDLK